MTFKALEIFKKNRPVEFYEFIQGSSAWRYTSADTDVTYLGNVYSSVLIRRGAIVFSGELAQDNVAINLPRDAAIAQNFAGFPTGALMTVQIYAQHRGEADTIKLWAGRYVNIMFKGAEAEFRFESITTGRKEQGLKRNAGPGCPHTLYDQTPLTCGVVKNTYKVIATPSIVSGATLTSGTFASKPDGYFDGGLLEFLRPDGITDARSIDTHIGNVITLRAPVPGLAAGDTVNVFPGCDHSLTVCADTFSNSDNHGGLPFRPDENPYDGNPIF